MSLATDVSEAMADVGLRHEAERLLDAFGHDAHKIVAERRCRADARGDQEECRHCAKLEVALQILEGERAGHPTHSIAEGDTGTRH